MSDRNIKGRRKQREFGIEMLHPIRQLGKAKALMNDYNRDYNFDMV